MQPGTHESPLLAFDGDAVPARIGYRADGVRADGRRIARADDLQRQVLARQRRRKSAAPFRVKFDREHLLGLLRQPRHRQRAEPLPAGLRADLDIGGRRAALVRGHYLGEGLTPARAERGDVRRVPDAVDVRIGQVQQAVHLRDGQGVRPAGDELECVADTYLPLADHAEVEAGAVVRHEQSGHLWLAEPHSDAKARHPRLGDLERRLADAVAITDADLAVGHAGDGEVLAERAVLERLQPQLPFPVPVGLDLVEHDRALFAAVSARIALAVAVHVEPAHHHRTVDRVLPDAGVHSAVTPLHIAGHADVDRQQSAPCAGHGCGHRRRQRPMSCA